MGSDDRAHASASDLEEQRRHLRAQCFSVEEWGVNTDGYAQYVQQFTLRCGLAALDKAGLREGERLLDVATGQGDIAVYAAREKRAVVDAIDLAPGMIDCLRAKLAHAPACCTAHLMDGHNLAFPDCTFDAVHSSCGVVLFSDFMQGMREMFRVTRPGGRAVVVGPSERAKFSFMPWIRVLEAEYPEALPLPLPPGIVAMGNEKGMRDVMGEAGFTNVSVSVVHSSFRFQTLQGVDYFMAHPFLKDVQQKLSHERWQELRVRVIAELEGHHSQGDGTVEYPTMGIIGCGKKP
jgi:ubiquinone/menaquinone biosynthesis C-methylase UbiE